MFGLENDHTQTLMNIGAQTSNLEFDGCTFNFGTYAMVFPASDGPRDVEIHHCDFNGWLPDHVYWCDVKNKDREVGEAYSEFQSEAVSGAAPGFFIHHNRFHDSFDGMDLKGGTENTRILHNEFYRLRDDAVTRRISLLRVSFETLLMPLAVTSRPLPLSKCLPSLFSGSGPIRRLAG